MATQRAYRHFCKAAAVVFVLVTVYTVTSNLLQGRLGHDWAHSLLHLGSAGWPPTPVGWLLAPHPRGPSPGAVGVGYFALGIYGWFTPGLLLGTPLAIPLGVPENLFHLLLSLPALAVALRPLRSASWHILEGR